MTESEGLKPGILYYACINCFHTEAYYQVHDRGTDLCPKCNKENMRELELMNIPTPAAGVTLLCLVCAHYKPWGIFDSRTGVSVCIDCRDNARVDSRPASPEEGLNEQFQDTEADGVEFCGKCGKKK